MKCPKCGNEIEDGKLYCGICGEEIRIVPDFDASEDETIDISISGVIDTVDTIENNTLSETKEIKKTTLETIPLDKPSFNNKKDKHKNKEKEKDNLVFSKRAIVFTVAVCCVFIILFILGYNKVSDRFSYETLYEKAFEQYEEEDYEMSIATIKRINSETLDEGLELLLADNYIALHKDDEALAALYTILDKVPSDINVIDRIINVYISKGDSLAVSSMLYSVNDAALFEKYSEYLKPSVEFSVASGNYDEEIVLEMYSSIDGVIYYTLDGEDVTTSSNIYKEPIDLQSGDYIVNAICVSNKGIESELKTAEYTIDSYIPPTPILNISSGKYNIPGKIEVAKGNVLYTDECYYTIDGENPTKDDIKYDGPFAMYIGNHEYKFAYISEKGVSSEVYTLNASLDIMYLVDVATAVNNLSAWAMLNGRMTEGKEFKCDQAIVYNNATYYIINEYEKRDIVRQNTDTEDEENENNKISVSVMTDNHYAVDVLTGLTFKARLNKSSGEYALEPLL